MSLAPRVNVIRAHIVLGGTEIATNAKNDHEAYVSKSSQLPTTTAPEPANRIKRLKVGKNIVWYNYLPAE
jgi:hypothetical protein